MKPYYEHNDITIYHGDCMEIIPQLKEIDFTVTSPPYNLGNNHHTNRKRHKSYNDNMTESEYQERQILILDLLFNVTSEKGSLFYNHKNRIKDGIQITPYQWLEKTQWVMKQEIVWHNGSPNFDNIRFYPHTERIYWLAKTSKTILNNRERLTDVWKIPPEGTKGSHTRKFPCDIPKRIMKSVDGDLILDPYMGSGTTLRAAKDMNRKVIGIEIEEQYCEVAVRRLQQEVFNFG